MKLFTSLLLTLLVYCTTAQAQTRVKPYCNMIEDSVKENFLSELNAQMHNNNGTHDVKSVFQNMNGDYIAVICRNSQYMPKKKKMVDMMNVEPMR